jgi:hypothetical protein
VPTDCIEPSAMPIAADTPMAGAPRTTIWRMASATSSHERSIRYFSSVGSRRWSIMRTPSSVHSTVLIMAKSLREVMIRRGPNESLR